MNTVWFEQQKTQTRWEIQYYNSIDSHVLREGHRSSTVIQRVSKIFVQREDNAQMLENTTFCRSILQARRNARRAWLSDTMESAARGDSAAITYLKQRGQPKASYQPLIDSQGVPDNAAASVKDRMQQLFGASDATRAGAIEWQSKLHDAAQKHG